MPKTLHIADLFCGAGGTSSGAVQALDEMGIGAKLTAINHWPVAIATHTANHPEARHLCTSIDDVNPRNLYQMGQLDVLWASPECTHHSRARGGKPMHDQSRATAWCVTRWAEALQPGIIFVENVPEFLEWGPLGTNGRPLKTKRGHTFRAWVGVLESLGYKVEWRVICAADFGAPTTRERLFVQAVRGRRSIKWPSRTHASVKELAGMEKQPDLFNHGHDLKPWVAAREIIDWTLPGRWLDEMPGKKQYGGLPLSPKTLRRIHAGLKRFGVKGFIIPGQTGEGRVRDIEKPLQTVTTESRGIGLVNPYIVPIDHTGNGAVRVNDIDLPLSTVTTENRHAVVEPFIVPNFGERENQAPRAHSVGEPLPAVTSHGAGAVVTPFLVEMRGTKESNLNTSGKDIAKPIGTITAGGIHHSIVQPYLVPTNHGGGLNRAGSIEEPLPTVCGNRGEQAVIEPHLLPQHSCGALRPVSQPAPTIATAGAIAIVEPFLTKFYGTGGTASLENPLDTVTTKDRFALVCPEVVIDGQRYRVRLRWRMLQPHELAQGQSFPKGYQFTGTKTDAVKQIGNAVPPAIANALMKAHFNES